MTPELGNWIATTVIWTALAIQLVLLWLWRKRWKELNRSHQDLKDHWTRFWSFHRKSSKMFEAALGIRDQITVIRPHDQEPYIVPRVSQEKLVEAVIDFDATYDLLGPEKDQT